MAHQSVDADSGAIILGTPVSSRGRGSQRAVSLLAEVSDMSITSAELPPLATDVPLRRHFSPARTHLLEVLDIAPGAHVIEASDGTGVWARALAERGVRVTAVVDSKNEARVTALRCRDVEGVSIVVGHVSDLPARGDADVVLLTNSVPAPQVALEHCRGLLTSTGMLAWVTDNPTSLERLLDGRWKEPSAGPQSHEPAVVPQRTVERLVADHGLHLAARYAVYPNHLYARAVVPHHIWERADAGRLMENLVGDPLAIEASPAVITADASEHHRLAVDSGMGAAVAPTFLTLARVAPVEPVEEPRVWTFADGHATTLATTDLDDPALHRVGVVEHLRTACASGSREELAAVVRRDDVPQTRGGAWDLASRIVAGTFPTPFSDSDTVGAIAQSLWELMTDESSRTGRGAEAADREDKLAWEALLVERARAMDPAAAHGSKSTTEYVYRWHEMSRFQRMNEEGAAQGGRTADASGATFTRDLHALRRHLREVKRTAKVVVRGKRARVGPLPLPWHRTRPADAKRLLGLTETVDAMVDRLRGGGAAPERDFEMFEGYQCHAPMAPVLEGPLSEPGLRVLGVMDSFRQQLVRRHGGSAGDTPVTVVVTGADSRAAVERAAQQLSAQTYTHWRAVVVTNAAVDADERITVVAPEEGTTALAVGLREAATELVAHLEAHCRWDRDFLTIMVGELAVHPEVTMAYSAHVVSADRAEPVPNVRALVFSPFHRSLLENRSSVVPSGVVHRWATGQLTALPTAPLADDYWALWLSLTETRGALAVPCVLSASDGTDAGPFAPVGPQDRVAAEQWQSLQPPVLEVALPGVEAKETLYALTDTQRAVVAGAARRPVAVVIPSYEAVEYLKVCVESVLQHSGPDVTVVIVDNASGPDVQSYLRSIAGHDGVHVEYNAQNRGFTHAVNQGIEIAGPDRDVVFLNNDALVTPGWLEGMWDALERVDSAGLVVPRQVYVRDIPESRGHVPYRASDREVDVTLSRLQANVVTPSLDVERGLVGVNFAPFFCVYIPRSTIDEVGLLNEEHGPHYRSDRMYCDLVRHYAGKPIVYTPWSKVYHFRQKATQSLAGADPSFFDAMVRKNRKPKAG